LIETSLKQALEIALGYPYERPSSSFVISNGTVEELTSSFDHTNRVPVIACGSNGAPEQLLRKFKNNSEEPVIVTFATLTDFVCCYSAHISGYGAIPTTLVPMLGVQTECHITWLTIDQLEKMHETEALGRNYRYSKLESISINCEINGQLNAAYAYIGIHGNLVHSNAPVALSEIPFTCDLSLPRLSQRALQELMIEKLSLKISVEKFIQENIEDTDLRIQRVRALEKFSQPFTYACETILEN